MSLIKQITSWRKYELPSLSRSIPLVTAYACMSCRCVQDGAKHGVCYTCGSQNLRSVSDAFDWMTNEIHKRLEEAKARKNTQQSRVQLTQEPQSLTEFRVEE